MSAQRGEANPPTGDADGAAERDANSAAERHADNATAGRQADIAAERNADVATAGRQADIAAEREADGAAEGDADRGAQGQGHVVPGRGGYGSAGGAVGSGADGGEFRAALYGRYVSGFKGAPNLVGEPSFTWWDHKYLPLLDGLERSAPILEIGCGGGALLAYLERRGFSHAMGIDISAEQVAIARDRGVHAECADAFDFLEARSAPDAESLAVDPHSQAPDAESLAVDPHSQAPDAASLAVDPHSQALDIQSPAFDGRSQAYAAIVAVDVFEHFSRTELLRLAPLLYAALQPGGRLLVQTANGAGLFPRQVIYGDLTHMTIFTPDSLAQLLRPVGFGDFAFYETGPIPIRLRGKLDVALWTVLKAVANRIRHIETGKRQEIWTENFICRAFKR